MNGLQWWYLPALFIITFPIMGRDFYTRKNLPGVLFALAVGAPMWLLGRLLPIAGGAVFGILAGIFISAWRRPSAFFEPGIKAASKKILQAAIVLFGFEMNLRRVIEVGGQSLLLMFFTISAALLAAWFVSRIFKMEEKTATLVGVGTAICGGSAIAAAAPAIAARDDQVATAISTIFLYNVLAVFIFPPLGRFLGMGQVGFGMWAGTAINDTSSVVAAAFTYGDEAGNLATIVKLTRTLMIIPITFVLALRTGKKEQTQGGTFSLGRIFPWFVLGFVATCAVNTSGIVPPDAAKLFGTVGKFLIVVAMTAIGLGTNLKQLLVGCRESLLLGGICWFVVAAVSLVVQYATGLM